MPAALVIAALLAIAADDAAVRHAPAAHWRVADSGQGPVVLAKGDTPARELGGITWGGGTRYYAVSDKLGTVFPLTIELDPHSGAIGHAVIEPGVRLPGSTDLEGVAYDRAHATVLVSDEVGSAIREYRIADGRLVRSIRVPAVFHSARTNFSLESLSLEPDRRVLWTANEEALGRDGPLSSARAGSAIRLQRFAADRPAGQWAYVTDPFCGDLLRPGRDVESSGVSDLVALPGGGLLALERAYGADGLRIRLYEIDLAGATDVGGVPGLAGATYTPVGKRLLWERLFPDVNFEGAALGPRLAAGGFSLILISDDGRSRRRSPSHRQPQALYALVLRGTE